MLIRLIETLRRKQRPERERFDEERDEPIRQELFAIVENERREIER